MFVILHLNLKLVGFIAKKNLHSFFQWYDISPKQFIPSCILMVFGCPHMTQCPQVMKFQCWVIAGCFFYGLVIRAHGYPTLQHHGGLLLSSLQVFTSWVMKETIWHWVQLHQPLPNHVENWPFKESRLEILSRVVVARFLDPFFGSCFLFSYSKGKMEVNV